MEKWFYFPLDKNKEGLGRCQVVIFVIVSFVPHLIGVKVDGKSDYDFDKLGAANFLNPTDLLSFGTLTLHADLKQYIMQRCRS